MWRLCFRFTLNQQQKYQQFKLRFFFFAHSHKTQSQFYFAFTLNRVLWLSLFDLLTAWPTFHMCVFAFLCAMPFSCLTIFIRDVLSIQMNVFSLIIFTIGAQWFFRCTFLKKKTALQFTPFLCVQFGFEHAMTSGYFTAIDSITSKKPK